MPVFETCFTGVLLKTTIFSEAPTKNTFKFTKTISTRNDYDIKTFVEVYITLGFVSGYNDFKVG